MAAQVLHAFNTGDYLLIEAGTGTGKSLGYLLPAGLFAVTNGCRVVVATNTLALQDQLVNKDIPAGAGDAGSTPTWTAVWRPIWRAAGGSAGGRGRFGRG